MPVLKTILCFNYDKGLHICQYILKDTYNFVYLKMCDVDKRAYNFKTILWYKDKRLWNYQKLCVTQET